MAIQIGRTTKVGFAKRGLTIPSSPINSGTFTTPTLAARPIFPWAWYPAIALLESPGVDGTRELPSKVTKGAGTISGLKSNMELEPAAPAANLFVAGFGQDTVSGDGATAPHAHNFESLNSAILPTYDWWHDEGDKQFGFAVCMANTWQLMWKAGENTRLEIDWNGLYYVDGLNLSPSLSQPAQHPQTFALMDLKLAGTSMPAIEDINIKIDNGVQVGHHVQSATNYANRVWSEHQVVTADWTTKFEDSTEYAKFLSVSSFATPTSSDLLATLTADDTFTEGTFTQAYKFLVKLPAIYYRTVEIELPTGVIKAKFTAVGTKATGTIGSGGNAYSFTSKSAVAQFINGVAGAY